MNMNMNAKKIRLHDHHYDGMSPAPRQLPASYAGLSSSPFHQALFMTSAPHQHYQQQQQYGGTEEYYGAGPSCVVGSSTAAFYAAENLLGMAQFDLPGSLGMLPPAMMMPAPVARTPPFRSSAESELYRPLDPLMLRAADQSSSVRTYYVRPQRRNAAELELELPMPPQPQQESVHHGLFGGAPAIQPRTFSPHVAAMEAPSSLQSQMESHHMSRQSCGGAPPTVSYSGTGNGGTAPTPASSKTRIRWTQDLHELFVERVNQLGGADKATPKGILKLMDSDVLTIYHIKSHLQKYRTARCAPPPSSPSEGKQQEKRGDTPNLDQKTGTHITEALRVQLDVQRRLHEQLEIQRRLQGRIEEQGKRLQKMFEDQLKASGNGNVPGSPPEQEHGDVSPPSKDEHAVFVIDVDDDDDDVAQLTPVVSSSYDDELA